MKKTILTILAFLSFTSVAYAANKTTVLKTGNATIVTPINYGTLGPCAVVLYCSLVGYWPFDGQYMTWTSGTAGTAIDVTGDGNTGILENMSQTTSPVIGRWNQALTFNGTSQYVDMGQLGNLNIVGNAVTVSAWVKYNAFNNYEAIAGNLNNGVSEGYDLYTQTTGPVFGVATAGGYVNVATALSDTKKWHFIAGVYNGSNITLYVDMSPFAASALQTGNIVSSNTDFYVGLNGYTGGLPYFSGSIDDVRVYNRALSLSEVKQLYDLGSTTIK